MRGCAKNQVCNSTCLQIMLWNVQGRLKMPSSYHKPLLNSKMTKEITEILKTKVELYWKFVVIFMKKLTTGKEVMCKENPTQKHN